LLTLADYKGKKDFSNEWATSSDINSMLSRHLGDSVHLIHPDACSVKTPLDSKHETAEEAAAAYVKLIKGFYNSYNELTLNGIMGKEGELTKPLVIPLNTHSATAEHAQNANAVGGVHWVMCVILPRQYCPPHGTPLNNDKETFFLMDSFGQRAFPNCIEQLWLSNGARAELKIPPLFPEAIIAQIPEVIQQKGGSCLCTVDDSCQRTILNVWEERLGAGRCPQGAGFCSGERDAPDVVPKWVDSAERFDPF
jgi:hypothetical protein